MRTYHDACATRPFDDEACKNACYGFLEAFSELRLLFRRGVPTELHNRQPFGMRPKDHVMQHIVEDKLSLYRSPANFWCYAD